MPKPLIGIDVSNAQGNILWDTVKEAGVEFAIIRCGWGSDAVKQDDPKFNEYVAQCEKFKIPYGVYIYSYALNVEAAKSEAQHTLRLLAGKKPRYGVWFDMEDADHYKQKHGINVYQSRQLITDMCKAYCEAIKAAGYNVGIYAALDYWRNVIYKDQVSQYPIWLAQWGPSKPSIECKMWQYTDKGRVPGINKDVDMDIMYSGTTCALPKETLKVGVRPTLRRGATGDYVEELQSLLKHCGYQCGTSGPMGDGIDGIFGIETQKALISYQNSHKACGPADGTCTPATWKSLFGR